MGTFAIPVDNDLAKHQACFRNALRAKTACQT